MPAVVFESRPSFLDRSLVAMSAEPAPGWYIEISPETDPRARAAGERAVLRVDGRPVYEWMVVYREGLVAGSSNCDLEVCRRHAELCFVALRADVEAGR